MKVSSRMVIPSLLKTSGILRSFRHPITRRLSLPPHLSPRPMMSMSSSGANHNDTGSPDSDSDPFTELEHKNWQRGVDAYANGFGPLTAQAVPTLLDRAGVPGESSNSSSNGATQTECRLLDVACGPGQVLSAAIARAGTRTSCTYTALDFSSNFLELAERNLSREHPETPVAYVEGDAQDLVAALGSGNDNDSGNDNGNAERFTSVTSNFGILHLSDPDAFLRESYRVLEPGGRLAFSAWAAPPATEAFDLVLGSVRAAGNPDVALPEGPPFFRFADPAEIRRSLEAAGFVDVRATVVEGMEWTNVVTPEDLYGVMLEGTARTRELLRGQTPEETKAVREELKRRFAERVGPLRMPAVVSSGRKPPRSASASATD